MSYTWTCKICTVGYYIHCSAKLWLWSPCKLPICLDWLRNIRSWRFNLLQSFNIGAKFHTWSRQTLFLIHRCIMLCNVMQCDVVVCQFLWIPFQLIIYLFNFIYLTPMSITYLSFAHNFKIFNVLCSTSWVQPSHVASTHSTPDWSRRHHLITFSEKQVWMGKYLKKSCSSEPPDAGVEWVHGTAWKVPLVRPTCGMR
jgi:hypothetical protein